MGVRIYDQLTPHCNRSNKYKSVSIARKTRRKGRVVTRVETETRYKCYHHTREKTE